MVQLSKLKDDKKSDTVNAVTSANDIIARQDSTFRHMRMSSIPASSGDGLKGSGGYGVNHGYSGGHIYEYDDSRNNQASSSKNSSSSSSSSSSNARPGSTALFPSWPTCVTQQTLEVQV
ncbi:hypothetical protein M422DRAFT_275823 [Sphaerobolus stellatus SS14]|uniref:Uncharacterized protein n=1 Tax=Sphaerobolus stellatus (strain SS14) TaxID=990650 RepID=A0A0C9T3X6_SPHS4|nr:hypothetical protein M422DRAFT_275823 [Sphaerobolus stellatus SS14]